MLRQFATRHICVCMLACLGPTSATAQLLQRTGSIEGNVTPARNGVGLTVELFDGRHRMVVDRTATTTSGQFAFTNVPVGNYEIRVTNVRGTILSHQFIRTSGSLDHVSLEIAHAPGQEPVTGTVSVNQLSRGKVPKDARKEFDKGVGAAEKSDSNRAIEHFRSAVEIAPDYMEAHVNLGARLLRVQKVEEAIVHLEKAIALDPGSSVAHANLAIGYMMNGRMEAAERAARQGERLDPTSGKARYILALALANQGENAEALHLLRSVSDELPRARIAIASILEKTGEPEGAAEELRKYLHSAAVEDREKTQAWLARLESSTEQAAVAGTVGGATQ